jgi:hypothetical protein
MTQHVNQVNLNLPLCEKMRDDIWSYHAKFQEFFMHKDEDTSL